MAETKKVVLLIVEGPTDADALNPILKKLFEDSTVRFHIVHGDITIKDDINSRNAVTKVNGCIKQEMQRYRYKAADLLRVIHIIDTDGAFSPDECVVYESIDHVAYTDALIKTSNVEGIIRRNKTKREVVRRLASTGKIQSIPYELYYMSRNLEHVLHGISEVLTDEEKRDYADEFADKYENDLDGFKQFICSSDFAVKGSFNETWEYIFQGSNSLKRHSNMHLMLKENPRAM